MRIFLATLGLGLLLITALARGQGNETLLQQGKEIFDNICAECHRTDGEGLPGTFPALNGNRFVTGDPKPVIATVLNGRHGQLGIMPTWKNRFNDDQIAGVVSDIRQAWSNKAGPVTPAMVAAVRGE